MTHPPLSSGAPAYALLVDGTTIEIRAVRPWDLDALRTLHRGLSPENLYLRFFSITRTAGDTFGNPRKFAPHRPPPRPDDSGPHRARRPVGDRAERRWPRTPPQRPARR